MRIGVDMDGVVTDFNHSMIELIRERFNPDIPEQSDSFPDDWYYFKRYVTPSQESFLWEYIHHPSSHFWENLRPYPEAIPPLLRLCRGNHDVYFITTRSGKSAKRQSELWLCKKAAIPLPTVLIADAPCDKGALVKALKLAYFVDDRPENCASAKEVSPSTEVFMINRPYNSGANIEGVVRVESLEGFASALDGVAR